MGRQTVGRHLPGGGQHTNSDSQVKTAAGLGQISRRQAHGDTAIRKLEARGTNGSSHPLPAFPHGGLHQAHQDQGWQTARYFNFNPHLRCGQTLLGARQDRRNGHADNPRP